MPIDCQMMLAFNSITSNCVGSDLSECKAIVKIIQNVDVLVPLRGIYHLKHHQKI